MDEKTTGCIIRKISSYNAQVLQLTHILKDHTDVMAHLSMASDKSSWTANAYIFMTIPFAALKAQKVTKPKCQ